MEVITIAPVLTFHFSFVKQIGEGGNSTVWSITTQDGKQFACKIPDEDTEDSLLLESQMMSKISKYPNKSPFLTFYGIYSHNGNPVSVHELFEGQELQVLIQHIRENPARKLTEQQILQVAKSLFGQVAYLNNIGLSHGDIHSSNILNNGKRLVLIDITGQYYNPDFSETGHAEVSKTTVEYWRKAINQGISPVHLLWKKDEFDIGQILRTLMGYDDIPRWDVYIQDPDKYKVTSEYPKLNILVNSAMEIDISKRPSASELLTYMNAN